MAKFFKNVYNKLLGDEAEAEQSADDENENEEDAVADEQNDEAEPAPRPQTAKSLEMKVVKPTAYDGNVMKIAEHLLKKRTVVLNLESAPKEASRRIVDFLSGVTFSIGGQLKPVASNIFIITPSNVDVSSDKLHEAAKAQASDDTADGTPVGYSEF